jgi:hypothetical protein
MIRMLFGSGALLLALVLAVAAAPVCEMHRQVHASTQELASTAPLSVPDPAPAASTVIVTPAAAAVAPQSLLVPASGRNRRQGRTTQALTQ